MIFAGVHDMEHLHHWYQWLPWAVGVLVGVATGAAVVIRICRARRGE